MIPTTSISRAAIPRIASTLHRRPLSTTPTRALAQPQPPSDPSELNEAQRYLADKAARKAQRLSNPTGASARHASLYSQLFPALLRILAYGSSAYFGLHLLWNVLDRDEQTRLMEAQTGGLEATARGIVEKVERAKEVAASTVSSSGPQAEDKAGKKRWYWPF
ncbi:conserved hypothetical protein [Sporisorium reilianum SRZ2]|uniref:Uncharacterized protein n=1 Tax=Sporisorium reilianum (strain SRZ2) TaxID=999809 RepID=E7A345_SPORE|nr:conserved hypothetical protein [Sporisorium reilianum SRZ2]